MCGLFLRKRSEFGVVTVNLQGKKVVYWWIHSLNSLIYEFSNWMFFIWPPLSNLNNLGGKILIIWVIITW